MLSLIWQLVKEKEHSLSYLPLAEGRIVGFIPFPKVLAFCKMHQPGPGFELR